MKELKGLNYRNVTCAFFFLFVLLVTAQSQQKLKVTGIVTDEMKKPLPGATVISSTSLMQGTMTDLNGEYTLQVDTNDTLVFSFVGYEIKRIPVGGKSRIDVSMNAIMGVLDEIIVIGYGSTSRELLTTSVSRVGGEQMGRMPINNVNEGLKGQISGVRLYNLSGVPGSEPVIRVRGGSSISQSNEPLVLIDGMERPLSDILPNDIESVTILKDAASTAIYGSRASNGVILVTTKRGEHKETTKIEFETNTGFQNALQRYDLMNAEEYVYFTRNALSKTPNHKYYNAYLFGNNSGASVGNTESSKFSTRYLNPGEEIPPGYKSIRDPIDTAKTIIFTDTNWPDIMFKNGIFQNYNLNVSGGSEKVSYRASIGYTDDDGITLSSGWSRFSARGNADIRITENLTFSGDMNYSESEAEEFGNQRDAIGRGAYMVPPTQKPYWPDGTPTPGNNATSPTPLFHDYRFDANSSRKRYGIGGVLTWQLLEKLRLNIEGKKYTELFDYNEFEYANFYSTARKSTYQTRQRNRTQFESNISYDRSINDHSLSAVLGYSFMTTDYFTSSMTASGGSTDKVQTLNAAPTLLSSSTDLSEEALIGYFSRVTYDFKKKYLISGVIRHDGSSRFASENRWGTFPGGSMAWIISKEPFMEDFKSLNLLKFRISYGLTGNNSVGLLDAFGAYDVNKPYNYNSGLRATTMPNKSLKWESTRQLDFGIDLSLFNDRLYMAADYFNKLTNDLIFDVPLPNTSGFQNVLKNVGKVRYNGFELTISSTNIKTTNFTWESNFNWGYVKNIVVELPFNGRAGNRIGGFVGSTGEEFGGIAEGEPLGRFYGFKVDHIIETQQDADNARYDEFSSGWDPRDGKFIKGRKRVGDYEWLDRDGDGRITSVDLFELGNEIPHTTGGLVNNLRYKNWSFNIVLDWALGHSVWDDQYAFNFQGTFHNNFNLSREALTEMWEKPGDNAKYAIFTPLDNQHNQNHYRVPGTDKFVYRGDYLCVRAITLAYDFSALNFTRKIGAKAFNVYTSVSNLHYFTEVIGRPPEWGGNTRLDDYANQGYPLARRVTFGLRIVY